MSLSNKIKIVSSRITTFNKGILFPTIVFIVSIFLIELKLKYIPACNEFQYNLGQIYLKICYSFTAATLFYFIVVHLPRERRKLKSFRYINNKSGEIDHELRLLVNTISNQSKISLDTRQSSLKEYEIACSSINPQNKFITILDSNIPFNNWFEYLNFKGENIRKLISELFILNEIFDLEYFQLLTFIDDEVSRCMTFKRNFPGNTDMSTWASSIFSIIELNNEMISTMREKMKQYEFEYHYEYRKNNKKKQRNRNVKKIIMLLITHGSTLLGIFN